jgi:hypothetical protein
MAKKPLMGSLIFVSGRASNHRLALRDGGIGTQHDRVGSVGVAEVEPVLAGGGTPRPVVVADEDVAALGAEAHAGQRTVCRERGAQPLQRLAHAPRRDP